MHKLFIIFNFNNLFSTLLKNKLKNEIIMGHFCKTGKISGRLAHRVILFLILMILFITLLYASNDVIHLVHADRTRGEIIDNERIKIFSGNVEFYQDTLHMYCDEVIIYEKSDRTDFKYNVLLYDGHRKLQADKVIYYTKNRVAHCYGKVRISEKKDSLYTEKLIYKFKSKNAEAVKNLYMWDKKNDTHIWGDYGIYYSAARQSHISGNCRLEYRNKNKKDTLIVTSKKMDYIGRKPKNAIASDSVYIKQGKLNATCDSAIYFFNDELIWLRNNPYAWQTDMEMKGTEIDLYLDSLSIYEIMITERAQIKSLVDSALNKFNILRGNSIQMFLTDGKPVKVIARKNASSIYYIVDDDSLEQGINSASSDSIQIFFREGAMDSVIIIGGVEGIFYPADYKGEIKSEY